MNAVQSLWLARFSKPATDRPVYQAILRSSTSRILEIGIEDGTRAARMIELAARRADRKIHYFGLDRFESAEDPQLDLKTAHQLLRATPAKSQLLPGDPEQTLARKANEFGQVDLVIVRTDVHILSRPPCVHLWPRLLHAASCVLAWREAAGGKEGGFHRVNLAELQQRAASHRVQRRAA